MASSNGGARSRARLRVVGATTVDGEREAPFESVEATEAERVAQIALDLELAQERLQMRRAMVAKLVEEYRTGPMQIPARALRTALVERDLTEEEC